MSDDLVKRLREMGPDPYSIAGWRSVPVNPDGEEAADKIEVLRAERDALKAELQEARMKSLSDLGQAADAYTARLKAEAELEALRAALNESAPSNEAERQ